MSAFLLKLLTVLFSTIFYSLPSSHRLFPPPPTPAPFTPRFSPPFFTPPPLHSSIQFSLRSAFFFAFPSFFNRPPPPTPPSSTSYPLNPSFPSSSLPPPRSRPSYAHPTVLFLSLLITSLPSPPLPPIPSTKRGGSALAQERAAVRPRPTAAQARAFLKAMGSPSDRKGGCPVHQPLESQPAAFCCRPWTPPPINLHSMRGLCKWSIGR